MKNSILFIGIAFVSLTNISNASNIAKKLSDSCQVVILDENNISNFEIIESVNKNKIEKSADELIAEDNAITDNNISNATEVLDFYIINAKSIPDEIVESVNQCKIEKSADELFAEDDAITENNISNATEVLDFYIINTNSIPDEIMESVNQCKIEKTTDELIAEDNAITESNISNETKVLDFELINRNSNLSTGKNKSFLVIN
jgi:type IV secretory pathway TrbL component